MTSAGAKAFHLHNNNNNVPIKMTEKDLETAKFTRLCPSAKMSYFREKFVHHINHHTLRVAKKKFTGCTMYYQSKEHNVKEKNN